MRRVGRVRARAWIVIVGVCVTFAAFPGFGAEEEPGREAPEEAEAGATIEDSGVIPPTGLRGTYDLGQSETLIGLRLELTAGDRLTGFRVRRALDAPLICEGITSATEAYCEFVAPKDGTVQVAVEAERAVFSPARYEFSVTTLSGPPAIVPEPEPMPSLPGEPVGSGSLSVGGAEVFEVELAKVTSEGFEVKLVEIWLAFDAPGFLDLDLYVFDADPGRGTARAICRSEGITGLERCELIPRAGRVWVQVVATDGVESVATDFKLTRRFVAGRLVPFHTAPRIRAGEHRQVAGSAPQPFRFTLDAGQVAVVSLTGHERSIRVEDEEGILYPQRRTLDGLPFVAVGQQVNESQFVWGGFEEDRAFLIQLGEAKGPRRLDANLSILRVRTPRVDSYLPILVPFRRKDVERRTLIVGELGLNSFVQRFATVVTDFFLDFPGAFEPPARKAWRKAAIEHNEIVVYRLRFESDIPMVVALTREPEKLDLDLVLLSKYGELLNADDRRMRLEPRLAGQAVFLEREQSLLAVVPNPYREQPGRKKSRFRIQVSRAGRR